MPYDVVKTLLTEDNNSISDTSFKIRTVCYNSFKFWYCNTNRITNEVFTAHSEDDVTVSIMTKGGSATEGEVGCYNPFKFNDYTLGGSPTNKTLTIDLGNTFNGSKLKVLATISRSVVSAKTKTNTTNETVTIDTQALAATNTVINLGKADVHKLNSVFITSDFSTDATTSDTDITDRFDLDTGQRDNFYDISRLVRKVGKPNTYC